MESTVMEQDEKLQPFTTGSVEIEVTDFSSNIRSDVNAAFETVAIEGDQEQQTLDDAGKNHEPSVFPTRKRVFERNFDCSLCGKKFLYIGHYKRHMKIHSDSLHPTVAGMLRSLKEQKNLPMSSGASETLAVKSLVPNMNEVIEATSINSVQGVDYPQCSPKMNINRNYICPVCSKGFGRNSHLKRHVKLHLSQDLTTQERTFPLGHCREEVVVYDVPSTDANEDFCTSMTEEMMSSAFVNPVVNTDESSKSPSVVDPLSFKSIEEPPNSNAEEQLHVASVVDESDDAMNTGSDECVHSSSSETKHQSDGMENEAPIISDIDVDIGVGVSDLPYSDDAVRVNKMINEKSQVKCSFCHKVFSQEADLRLHETLHAILEQNSCKICGKHFDKKSDLEVHLNTIHTAAKTTLYKIHTCDICGKSFKSMSYLKKHRKLHGERKNTFAFEAGLIKKFINEDTKTECFQCELCGESYQEISNAKAHLNSMHIGAKIFEKGFNCSFCGKQFGRNSHLKRHLKLHIGGSTFTCELCGRCFKQNGNLKAHIRMVHLKERSFQCTHCGKMFLQRSNLNTHMRTHTGEKPYECTLCGKSFTQGSQLKYHMSSHLGERPFSCPVCEKKFTNNRSCRRHMKIHTGEKDIECKVCSKRFRQQNQLTTHMRTHTGEKPFQCSKCKKKFTNKRGRDKHVLLHCTKWSEDDNDSESEESEDYFSDFDDDDDGDADPDSDPDPGVDTYDSDGDIEISYNYPDDGDCYLNEADAVAADISGENNFVATAISDENNCVSQIEQEIDIIVKEEPEEVRDIIVKEEPEEVSDYEFNYEMISDNANCMDPLESDQFCS